MLVANKFFRAHAPARAQKLVMCSAQYLSPCLENKNEKKFFVIESIVTL